ncbi:hypothetical protein FGG08_000133 [Glutinoglossum americanum]|uniref:Uncharacterized protein n=1 Tax=Glutinoglossum americanum TaxID=1670608 RepID=A0A9P8IDQ3_9PEZI|nr:hypothetical protein FGG08_000133 [Glutinoglossum americanum]
MPLLALSLELDANHLDHSVNWALSSTSMSAIDFVTAPEQGREEVWEDSKWGDDNGEMPPAVETVPKKKKKKKNNKSKVKKITGFEENYTDAPMTPAEYAEEMENIYNPSRTFAERIEACIQRYRAKRKFDSHRKDLFDKYLSLGGIETGPKMFGGGLDAKAADSMDAQEIVIMTATDYVGKDKSSLEMSGQQNSEWVVDFEAVAKGYFSHKIPTYFDITDPKEIKLCTSVVRNFLNYVLHHNVCPEYNDQVYAARAICDLAENQLSAVVAVSHKLQGDFNKACSTLFGGHYRDLYVEDQELVKEMGLIVGMSDENARKIVHTGLAAMGTLEQCQQAKTEGLKVTREENIGFEVTEILRADEDTRNFFKSIFGGEIKCLGTLRGRQWTNPDWLEEDESEGEEEGAIKCLDEYEFWVEEDALEHLVVGMKVEVAARYLNCGFWYFDIIFNVHCSFFTYLENERMSSYKEYTGIDETDSQKDIGFDEGEAELEEGISA